jgi:hydrogenase maturation protease
MSNQKSTPKILILGCGNDLRGDDAVGRIAASRIEELSLDGVEVWSDQMFMPETAPMLAAVDLAIFIDACEAVASTGVRVREVELSDPEPGQTHHTAPPHLLGMAAWLYGKAPRAFAIDIPARRFEITGELTEIAKKGVEDAVKAAVKLINGE